jgi:hypothetical protein
VGDPSSCCQGRRWVIGGELTPKHLQRKPTGPWTIADIKEWCKQWPLLPKKTPPESQPVRAPGFGLGQLVCRATLRGPTLVDLVSGSKRRTIGRGASKLLGVQLADWVRSRMVPAAGDGQSSGRIRKRQPSGI